MQKKLLVGFWRFILKIPPSHLEKRMEASRRRIQRELAFMTAEHRKVHHQIVRELPGHGRPMRAEHIAAEAGLPLNQVGPILDDLDET